MTDYNVDLDLLKEVCPVYNLNLRVESEKNDSNVLYTLSDYDIDILNSRNEYINRVETGNKYIDNLKEVEEEYFTKKYGKGIYNYLLAKRDAYIQYQDNVSNKSKDDSCSINIISSNNDGTFESSDVNDLANQLHEDISGTFQMYQSLNNLKDADFQTLNNNVQDVQSKIEDIYKQNQTNQRKIEYRKEEMLNIDYYDSVITYVYLIFLFLYLIYLIIMQQLNIMQNWYFYILLIIFPIFIYPIIFHYANKLLMYLKGNMNTFHGPKTAFINNIIDPEDVELLNKYDV
jgi:hypothetical protein